MLSRSHGLNMLPSWPGGDGKCIEFGVSGKPLRSVVMFVRLERLARFDRISALKGDVEEEVGFGEACCCFSRVPEAFPFGEVLCSVVRGGSASSIDRVLRWDECATEFSRDLIVGSGKSESEFSRVLGLCSDKGFREFSRDRNERLVFIAEG